MSGSSPTGATRTRAIAEVGQGAAAVTPALAVAVAVSGGPDSLALLHVTWRVAQPLGVRVFAFHVHHNLQAAADAWPGHLADECARWSAAQSEWRPIELRVRRLQGRPARGQSVEEWAREGRRAALCEMAQEAGVDLVLLAHHLRDQAETFLLQALRGAGPEGLAGMPAIRHQAGIVWARPWIAQPRETILQHVQDHGLRPVADPSNEDVRWARNRLRLQVWPALEAAFPGAQQQLAQAARQCARALPALLEAAAQESEACFSLLHDAERVAQLKPQAWALRSESQRAAALRALMRHWGIDRVPRTAVEAIAARKDFAGAGRLPLKRGLELRWYRCRLEVQGPSAASFGVASGGQVAPLALTLRRSGPRRVEAFGGTLTLRPALEGEAALPGPLPLAVWLRSRAPGDRFQRAPKSIPRALKKQFQSVGVPEWARGAPVVCDAQGRMVMVPGLGLDARATDARGRWVLEWWPDP